LTFIPFASVEFSGAQYLFLKHKTAGQQKAGDGGWLFFRNRILPGIHSPLSIPHSFECDLNPTPQI